MIAKQKLSHIKGILTLGTLNKILALAVAYISISVFTALLGKDIFGSFLFYQSVFTYIIIISIFGFDKTIIYRVAGQQLSREYLIGKNLTLKLARLSLILNLILDIALMASLWLYSDTPINENIFWVCTLGTNAIFLVIYSFYQAMFEANMRAKIIIQINCISNLLRLLSLGTLYFFEVASYSSILIFLLLPSFISLLLAFREERQYQTNSAQTFTVTRDDYQYSATMMLTKASFIISEKADIIFIGVMLSATDVANYGVAAKLAMLVAIGNELLNPIISPRLKAKITLGSVEEITHEYNFNRYFSSAFALLTTLLLCIFGKHILSFFGDYEESFNILVILSLALFNKVAFGPNGRYLMLCGYERTVLLGSISSAALLCTLSLLLIPEFGMIGAASSVFASLLSLNICLDIFLACTLKIRFLNWKDYLYITLVNILILQLIFNTY